MQRPHWYFYYLGTEPEKQGTGIGAAVMRPVLDLCDRHRLPAYAEASSPRNRTSDWPPDGPELGSNAAARRRPRRRLALARSPRRDGGFRAPTGNTGPTGWRELVQGRPPTDDPSALVVRQERDHQVYGTVFAEIVDARPGLLRVE